MVRKYRTDTVQLKCEGGLVMSFQSEIIHKKTLQTSETCTLLGMSRQNLYKMRKEGRMYRLIETQDSKFDKESVYQEWFQRGVKGLNVQVSMQPMQILNKMLYQYDNLSDTPFTKQLVLPLLDVLLANYGTSDNPVYLPSEYCLRLYHYIAEYTKDMMETFDLCDYYTNRIDTDIYAFIEYLKRTIDDDDFNKYIDQCHRHCFHQTEETSIVESFIEMTDIFYDNVHIGKSCEAFLKYVPLFRENMILTLVDVIERMWANIYVTNKTDYIEMKQAIFNKTSSVRNVLRPLIYQLLVILYDMRGRLV